MGKSNLVIVAICCLSLLVHFTITVSRVGTKIGDYDVNREFGQRFLAHSDLYQGGQCFNYMPISALYWAPLALAPPRVGMALRYVVALVCLGLTIRFLWLLTAPGQRLDSRKSWAIIGVSLFLTGHYLIRDFDDGGPHVILLAILMGGMYCFWRGREKLGAFWLGLGIAVKITPGLFLPYFLWKRQWRWAGYTFASTVGWILLPAIWMGPVSWWRHQREWNQVALSVVHDSSDALREDNEQRVQNQALKPALLRYFVTYPTGHPMRLEQAGYFDFLNCSPDAASRAANLVLLGLGGIFCWRSRQTWNGSGPRIVLGETSALLLLVLLFSPVTWLQHFVFALPAIYWIVATELSSPRPMTRCLLALYVLLAVIMNRELLGRANYLLLLSYHTHTLCLLLLFTMVAVGMASAAAQVREACPVELPTEKNQAA